MEISTLQPDMIPAAQVLAGTWYNAVDSNGYLRRQTVTQCAACSPAVFAC